MISATGNHRSRCAGFSLVELLTVVAIMAIVMGIVVYGVSGMQRPGLQVAASQVASGLSLARQTAITRNTVAAFLVATATNAPGLPSQPYRYWAVASSNRGAGTWTLRKDWEKLPDGVVFFQTLLSTGPAATTYNTINNNPLPAGVAVGLAAAPPAFSGTTNYSVTAGGSSFNFTAMPSLRFRSDGSADGSSTAAIAARLVDGAVNNNGQVILRNTNRYFFVETDANSGRIRVRAPESYR